MEEAIVYIIAFVIDYVNDYFHSTVGELAVLIAINLFLLLATGRYSLDFRIDIMELVEKREFEVSIGKVVYEDGVVEVFNNAGVTISKTEAEELVTLFEKLAQELDRKLALLIHGTNVRAVDHEARTLFSSERADKCVSARAITSTSPVARAIGNFYQGLNRAPFPTRLFSSESEALEWLKSFTDRRDS